MNNTNTAAELSQEAQQVKQRVLEFLAAEQEAWLSGFFSQTQVRLEQMAAGAEDFAQRHAASQAAVWFQRSHATVRTELYQQMVQKLSAGPQADAASIDELCMMEETELSISIARARLVTSVFRQAQALLDEMLSRLQQLDAHGGGIDPDALVPGRIADFVVNVLAEHGLPVAAQASLIEALGDTGTRELIRFYEGLNQLLAKNGVTVTGLKPAPSKRVNIASAREQRKPPELLQQLRQMIAEVPRAEWRRGQLRYLLHRYFRVQPDHPGLAIVPLEEMDQLEKYLLTILSDVQLSERMRYELIRLLTPLLVEQLPMMAGLMQPQNAVRVFLEQLCEIGRRDEEQPLREFEMIRALVGRIVAERGQVLDSFHSGAEALHTIARREVTRRVRSLPVAADDYADEFGAMTPDLRARQQVVTELRELVPEVTMQPELKEFVLSILGPWMMRRYLRDGEGSSAWAEARAFAALFFDALKPADTPAERPRKRALRRQTLLEIRLRVQRSTQPVSDKTERLMGWLENRLAQLDEADASGESSEDLGIHLMDTDFLDCLPGIQPG